MIWTLIYPGCWFNNGVQLNEYREFGSTFLTFASVAEVIRAENSHLVIDEQDREVSRVTHNLKGPIFAMTKQLGVMTAHIKEYLRNPPPPPMTQEEANVFRFSIYHLKNMVLEYLVSISKPTFFEMDAKNSPDSRATTERTKNCPGVKAPVRKSLGVPQTEGEVLTKTATGELIEAKEMKKGFLRRFVERANTEEKMIQQEAEEAKTSAANGWSKGLSEFVNTLIKALGTPHA